MLNKGAEMPTKVCTKCNIEKPATTENFSTNGKWGLHSRCRLCANAASSRWYQDNRQYVLENRDRERSAGVKLKRYGLTLEQYESLLVAQGGVCAICKKPPVGERLCIDHDHSCCPSEKACPRCIRGLVCRPCNLVLGNSGDNVTVLQDAIIYLGQKERPCLSHLMDQN